jgi:rhamnose utilization protein RhaD (predicted bifunctional aldolase and dehydrogenase)/NAD(P)-dependent dehydrogenase (short-subunit alcohol dehydrogenase family)
MAELDELSDVEMVKYQRSAMTNPLAPNPSVEAILHAIIPFTFVDHTHADAVVTITNSPNGKQKIQELYGENMLIVPYVMPGFVLAQKIYKMTQGIDWNQLDGMVLMNHGVFTFHDDPKVSYENMISVVSKAERYLQKNSSESLKGKRGVQDSLIIANIRHEVSKLYGKPVLAKSDNSPASTAFSNLQNLKKISNRGPITPDHIIRTKRNPVVIGNDPQKDILNYANDYRSYFKKYNTGDNVMLDQAPRWAIIPGSGSLFFGPQLKQANIIMDIAQHTQKAIYQAEQLGGWKPLGKKELFEMEYWSLEQAKLKKAGSGKSMQGKVALVSGAANGIGKACVEHLIEAGAVVAALDIDPIIMDKFSNPGVLTIRCDMTKEIQIKKAVDQIISHFGGLDMIISNAGIFPKSATIENMEDKIWEKSLAVNVSSHQKLLQVCVPFLELGFDPAVVIIGSKNVPAPGPGASAYSVAKAGLTQLGRIAALELGEKGIRVNIVHPNAVYDTAIWTDEVLEARSKHYGLTVKEYKTNNVLKVEVKSSDVAELAVAMLGKTFSKITGAQIPIDGGNDRVI